MKPNTMFLKTLTKFNTNLERKKEGFFSEILFHGFNLTSKRRKLYRPKYQIDTHKSEIAVCHEKINHAFKSHVHKRRLIYFSHDSNMIQKIKTKIKGLKIPDPYTGKGLIETKDIYKIKARKKRK